MNEGYFASFFLTFMPQKNEEKTKKNVKTKKYFAQLTHLYVFSRKTKSSSIYGKKNGKIFFGFYFFLVNFFVIKPHSSLYNHLYVHFRIFLGFLRSKILTTQDMHCILLVFISDFFRFFHVHFVMSSPFR